MRPHKIIYGIALRDGAWPDDHGRLLRVGEQVNDLFAVRPTQVGPSGPTEDTWTVDHLPTGCAAGIYWSSRELAIRAADELADSMWFESPCCADYNGMRDDPEMRPIYDRFREMYLEEDEELAHL